MRQNRLIVALVAATVLFTSGCLSLGPSGADAGSTSSPSTSSATDASTSDAAVATGAGCGVDSQTGTTLCRQVDLCPSLAVDPAQYPNCGFRVHGSAIDLECACSGSLCPVGAPTTCAQASQLLASQNEGIVCSQVNEGRCVESAPAPTQSSSCDKVCAGECGNSPNCLSQCGC